MVKLFIDVQRFTASIHCSRFDWIQWIFIYNVSCTQKHIQLQINVFKCVPLKAYHMVTYVAVHLYRIKPILYVMSNFESILLILKNDWENTLYIWRYKIHK